MCDRNCVKRKTRVRDNLNELVSLKAGIIE